MIIGSGIDDISKDISNNLKKIEAKKSKKTQLSNQCISILLKMLGSPEYFKKVSYSIHDALEKLQVFKFEFRPDIIGGDFTLSEK